MSFGLLPTGFVRPRLDEIKAAIEADLRATFGEIETGPESVFGQLVGIFSKQLADVWESIEDVHVSFDPDKSEGVSLDNAAQLVAVERLPATRSTAVLRFFGAIGTFIPQGSAVFADNGVDRFTTLSPESISPSRLSVATLRGNFGGGDDFRLAAIGVPDAFPGRVLTPAFTNEGTLDFVVAILELGPSVWKFEKLTPDGGFDWKIRVTSRAVLALAAAPKFRVEVFDDTEIQTGTIGIDIDARADLVGATSVLPDTINQLETPIIGVSSVSNPDEGQIGRSTESDEDLRIRRRRSVRIIGATTVDALRARLFQEVADVRAVVVRENKSIETDSDGIPPHSFESVVLGGNDTTIAERIWALKPAGIGTHGNIQINVPDSQGDLQAVFFSRPVEKYVWINVVLTLQEDSALFPAGGESIIQQALVAHGETLAIGEDVRYQRLFAPIFETAGIAEVALTLTTTDDPEDVPAGFAADNLDMGAIDLAVFDVARIDVTIA